MRGSELWVQNIIKVFMKLNLLLSNIIVDTKFVEEPKEQAQDVMCFRSWWKDGGPTFLRNIFVRRLILFSTLIDQEANNKRKGQNEQDGRAYSACAAKRSPHGELDPLCTALANIFFHVSCLQMQNLYKIDTLS